MARRVKAEGDAVVFQGLTVGQGLQADVLAKPCTQDARARFGGQVMGVARARMVAMAVGNHRAFDRAPRVDIKIPGRAVQTFRSRDNKVHGHAVAMGLLCRRRGQGGKFEKGAGLTRPRKVSSMNAPCAAV